MSKISYIAKQMDDDQQDYFYYLVQRLLHKSAQTVCSSDEETEQLAAECRLFLKANTYFRKLKK